MLSGPGKEPGRARAAGPGSDGGPMSVLDPYGLRRVVSPAGALPQAAERLDPALPLADDELEIDVEHLNIDAASFRQLEQTAQTEEAIASRILGDRRRARENAEPGHGSGGMLIGRVRRVGSAHPQQGRVRPGDRVATLVSLTLTPLELTEIRAVHRHSEQVDVAGRAILFASGAFAALPDDLPQTVALAVLDVCGAPAWVERLVRPKTTLLVIGAGKSGSLACAAAREKWLAKADPLARPPHGGPPASRGRGLADVALAADATRPLEVMRAVADATVERWPTWS